MVICKCELGRTACRQVKDNLPLTLYLIYNIRPIVSSGLNFALHRYLLLPHTRYSLWLRPIYSSHWVQESQLHLQILAQHQQPTKKICRKDSKRCKRVMTKVTGGFRWDRGESDSVLEGPMDSKNMAAMKSLVNVRYPERIP